jgi:hypothetical protein
MEILIKVWLRSRKLLLTVVGLVFLISTLILIPRYINQQIKQKADSFCRSVQIGESLQSLLNKCNTSQVKCTSWKPVDGIVRYQAWFSGFLLYDYACEIRSENEKVISKFLEGHTD